MSQTILVIEDERGTRRSLKNFLASEGYDVLTAENGRLGIELAQNYVPDLIICDIMMPELDGYDVLRVLQSELKTSRIPFIFLTISADEVGCQQSLELGADDYLKKPVTSDRLRTAIQNQISAATGEMLPVSDVDSSLSSGISPGIQSTDIQSLQERLLIGLCRSYMENLLEMNQMIEALTKDDPETARHPSIVSTRERITYLLRITNQTTALSNSLPDGNLLQLIESFVELIQQK